jgi:hypothetical protein
MLEFTHRNLFEDDEHRARFKDLLDCYCSAPFFSKGLCKCMYLSAWDDAHFTVMLDVLNEMVLERDDHLGMMKDNGSVMEQQAEGGGDIGSAAIIEASVDFLNDIPYDRSRLHTLEIEDPDAAYIIKRGLLAAQCIDDLPPIDR